MLTRLRSYLLITGSMIPFFTIVYLLLRIVEKKICPGSLLIFIDDDVDSDNHQWNSPAI